MFCFYAVLKERCGYKEVDKRDRDPLSCSVPLSALSILSRALTFERQSNGDLIKTYE